MRDYEYELGWVYATLRQCRRRLSCAQPTSVGWKNELKEIEWHAIQREAIKHLSGAIDTVDAIRFLDEFTSESALRAEQNYLGEKGGQNAK